MSSRVQAKLSASEVPVVVATNQSAIGLGLTSREAVDEVHKRMTAAIEASGGPRVSVYVCPHAPRESCECRKPRPGLLWQAARELPVDLGRSVFVGDSPSDLTGALAAGCRAIAIGPEASSTAASLPLLARAATFAEATAFILADPLFAGRQHDVRSVANASAGT